MVEDASQHQGHPRWVPIMLSPGNAMVIVEILPPNIYGNTFGYHMEPEGTVFLIP